MHKNPNLVPTVITNANGWITTVYRKPQSQTAKTGIPAPAPTVETNQTLSVRIAKLYEELHDEPISERALNDTRNLIRTNYEFETLKIIETEMAKGGEIARGLCFQIDNEQYDQDIKYALHFYPMLGIDDYARVTALVEAAHRYPLNFQLHDLMLRDQEAQETAVAVMKLTHLIDLKTEIPIRHDEHPLGYAPLHSDHGEQWRYATIRNHALVEYIMEHPDEVESVAEIVAKHNVTDPNAILGIRDGITPSLAEGSL